jgi:fructose-1,6-bisphosphatase III
VHVVSDVHGEHKKLRHILGNASGSLRSLVTQAHAGRLDDSSEKKLLALLYYPREAWAHHAEGLDEDQRGTLLSWFVAHALPVLRAASGRVPLRSVAELAPAPYRTLVLEMLAATQSSSFEPVVTVFAREQRELELVRLLAHAVRNLAITEVVVAGDLGDRGPRLDRVVDLLLHQPNVSITWGNHDASWMGACLGQEACIATVVRIALRYGRLSQLEEGYGIPLAPVEQLARAWYGEDPAERFRVKLVKLRDPLLLARMQKAMAVLQLKLEAQTTRRNPSFDLEHRNLLHRMDRATGTVTIDGREHPLLDTTFPTLRGEDPYALVPEEQECIDALRSSFLESDVLWRHMQFVARRGSMHLVRDGHLIFHGCVPVDESGAFLPLEVDGRPLAGRALFEAITALVPRAFRERRQADVDLLYYLWAGPRSPLFGKDRMATFETYLVEDKATHKETKNPYFTLIHEASFCERVLRELGAPADGMIVNGHVPVKLEAGESPVKRSGRAVTIDGAFSEAYGDKGYTLVLEDSRTYLAQHHHFESVERAIVHGEDIFPTCQVLTGYARPRTVGDTEQGDQIRSRIELLRALLAAYRDNVVRERPE